MYKKIFLGLLIAGLLVAGGVTAVSAYGQNPPICPTEPIPQDVLGMTVAEVREELSSGKTMKEIFEEKGLDYEEYLNQWLADHEACLEEAVADGKLTQAQADLMLERLQDRVEDGLFFYQNRGFGDSMRSYMQFRTEKMWEGGHGLIGELLDKLEITFEDLKARISGGETLEEIADEAGIDLDALHQEFIQKQLENVDQALADGKITEEQADRIRERLNERLEDPASWNMFYKMQERMDRPYEMFKDGGRPGGMGHSRGNGGGCW